MKCPYCGKEMEQGYIQCRDGVIWNNKTVPVAVLGSLSFSALRLGEYRGPWGGHAVVAWNCTDCQKITIDY